MPHLLLRGPDKWPEINQSAGHSQFQYLGWNNGRWPCLLWTYGDLLLGLDVASANMRAIFGSVIHNVWNEVQFVGNGWWEQWMIFVPTPAHKKAWKERQEMKQRHSTEDKNSKKKNNKEPSVKLQVIVCGGWKNRRPRTQVVRGQKTPNVTPSPSRNFENLHTFVLNTSNREKLQHAEQSDGIQKLTEGDCRGAREEAYFCVMSFLQPSLSCAWHLSRASSFVALH